MADNYEPITDATGNDIFSPALNPGGSNAVNVYGDEYNIFTNGTDFNSSTGLNSYHRRGIKKWI
ncbi:MAG: hypothetical protein IPJ13_12785 [Saprospiraceae bacterium]|nr:hypothetical protein [Saprospiraceae bacterium]